MEPFPRQDFLNCVRVEKLSTSRERSELVYIMSLCFHCGHDVTVFQDRATVNPHDDELEPGTVRQNILFFLMLLFVTVFFFYYSNINKMRTDTFILIPRVALKKSLVSSI